MIEIEITQDHIDLVRKHLASFLNEATKYAERKGYEVEQLDTVGLLDEMLCCALDRDIIHDCVETIEESIGLEEYGFSRPD
jgi:hypothetical protein